MADIQRTVEIIFGAIDNTGSGLSSVSDSLNHAIDKISTITEPLAEVSKKALEAEAAIGALAAAYGGYAIDQASKFQTSQLELVKTLHDGDPDIGTFTQSVMDLSNEYGISATTVMAGVAAFKQAGYSATESTALQKDALDLMITGNIDATRAQDILTTSLKGFGAEASDAPRFIEALTNVSENYSVTVDQLGTGMTKIAPIIHQMGFSFEEGTGLLTPMIEAFKDGDVAGQALKSGLDKLLSSADAKTLTAMGIAQTDLNGAMRSGHDIFYDVADAFQNIDENQKLVLAGQLFGIRQGPQLITVFDNLAEVNKVTATAMEHTGSVTKEVTDVLDSAEKQTAKFKVGFDNLAITLGGKILSEFSGVAGAAGDLETSFAAVVNSGGLDAFFDALKPKLAEFQDLLETMAKNLPEAFAQVDFSKLLGALSDLGFEISDLFGNIDLSTPEGLAHAIQFVVDSFASLTNVVAGIVDVWGPVVKGFLAGIEAFDGLDSSTQKTAGQFLGLSQIFEDFKGYLSGGTDALKAISTELIIIGGIDAAKGVLGLASAVGAPELLAFVGVALAIKFGVTENITAWQDYNATQNTVADSSAHLIEVQKGTATRLDEISKSTGFAITSMKDFNDAVDSGRIVFDEATKSYIAAGSGVHDYDAEVGAASKNGFDFAAAVNKISDGLGITNDSLGKVIGQFTNLADAEASVGQAIDQGYKTSITYADGMYILHGAQQAVTTSTEDLGKKTKEAGDAAIEGSKSWREVQDVMLATQKQTDDFSIKLGELSNKRYEIDVKANVDLRTAEIVADTARISAAFQATSSDISTLTKGADELWGIYAKTTSSSKAMEIQDAIKNREQQLQTELDQKQQLTDAIVAKMNAQTDRLTSGDALIRIDSGDLAPELDSLFEKVLKRVQIKATEEGFNLLLGLGAN